MDESSRKKKAKGSRALRLGKIIKSYGMNADDTNTNNDNNNKNMHNKNENNSNNDTNSNSNNNDTTTNNSKKLNNTNNNTTDATVTLATEEEKLKELKEAFQLFDKDGNGLISASELGQVIKILGRAVEDEELRVMIEHIDDDGNGQIDFREFKEMMSSRKETREEEMDDIRQTFRVFDKDGDGFISPSELNQVVDVLGENLSEDELQEMIKEVDVDGNGLIDFEEFKKLFAK